MTSKTSRNALISLVTCGTLSWIIYGVIAYLSSRFAFDVPSVQRPLLLVLVLLATNFLAYLIALKYACRCDSAWLSTAIISFALAFRAVIISSEPIQEIDIYRYIWDGVVTTHGVSPFAYAPQEVLTADHSAATPPALKKLVEVRDSATAIGKLLSRVHFAELPTVYPTTSQAIFACAAFTTPGDASASMRLTVMKMWLLLFDVGTIFIVSATLRQTGLHRGWLLAYAWCPLVIKEFANSGHLDSIAVFLSSLAMYLAVLAFFPRTSKGRPSIALTAHFVLALAVAAKLYPVVFVPLLFGTTVRRFGFTRALMAIVLWATVTALLMSPMLVDHQRSSPFPAREVTSDSFRNVETELAAPITTITSNPRAGLKAFLSSWIMNDFIFLNLIENLTPDAQRELGYTPWFVMTPDTWRAWTTQKAANALRVEPSDAPFIVARGITASIFFGLAMYWAWRAAGCDSVVAWFEYVFLTVAWFWLLLPTLNPWYWIWALPWIPFCRNRTWLVLSGLVLMYYLRFYFGTYFPDRPVVSFLPYPGESFFDFVVVWFEYLPWLLCLAITSWWRLRNAVDHRISC